MIQKHGHDGTTHNTFNKRDHKIVLKKRLERARKVINNKQHVNHITNNQDMDNHITHDKVTTKNTAENKILKEETLGVQEGKQNTVIRRKEEYNKKNKPNPFTHAQQQATHYDNQRQLLHNRMQQERLEKDAAIKGKQEKRAKERKIHLSRTRRGQPKLGGMLEGLLGRIQKQLHQ